LSQDFCDTFLEFVGRILDSVRNEKVFKANLVELPLISDFEAVFFYFIEHILGMVDIEDFLGHTKEEVEVLVDQDVLCQDEGRVAS
jgi:hypothetical protein